jgi:prevent-host-death family protein
MYVANIGEAKTHLSDLIARAVAGEEIVIARAGRPVVRLGKVKMSRDFDELPESIAAAFRGEQP